MAGGLSTAIGDALLSLVQFVWPEVSPQIEHFAHHVADAIRPEPPFTLQTPDGQVVTGIVVLDRGRAMLFFGVREAPVPRPAYQVPERTYPERGYPERTYDDAPLWPSSPHGR